MNVAPNARDQTYEIQSVKSYTVENDPSFVIVLLLPSLTRLLLTCDLCVEHNGSINRTDSINVSVIDLLSALTLLVELSGCSVCVSNKLINAHTECTES